MASSKTSTSAVRGPPDDSDHNANARPRKKRAKASSKAGMTGDSLNSALNIPIASIPTAFRSESGHNLFSKAWWKEVTSRDEFWEELQTHISATTWKKRVISHVVINTTSKGPPSASGRSSKANTAADIPKKAADPVHNEGNNDINARILSSMGILGSFQCDTCGMEFVGSAGTRWDLMGGVRCNKCMNADDNDIFTTKAQDENKSANNSESLEASGPVEELVEFVTVSDSKGNRVQQRESVKPAKDKGNE